MGNFSLISPKAQIGKGTTVGRFVIIEDGVQIGQNCHIGDYCRIAKNVVIGDGNDLGSRVSVYSNTVIGNNNRIFEGCVIGLPSEHIGYHLYQGKVIIGDGNHICSGCTIDCGNSFGSDKKKEFLPYITEGGYPEDVTVIGNRCFILQGVTIHHNCHVGLGSIPNSEEKDYDTIICCGCCLNGFVHVGKGCELSSGTFVREWISIGQGAFTAMRERIVKNVSPFTKILKNRSKGVVLSRVEAFGLKCEDVKAVEYLTVEKKFY